MAIKARKGIGPVVGHDVGEVYEAYDVASKQKMLVEVVEVYDVASKQKMLVEVVVERVYDSKTDGTHYSERSGSLPDLPLGTPLKMPSDEALAAAKALVSALPKSTFDAIRLPAASESLRPVINAFLSRIGSLPRLSKAIEPEDAEKVADSLVNTLADHLADASPEEDLGPFYSTAGLTKRLGVTRQALDGRVTRHTLLALPGDDGSRLYPAFQFVQEGDRLTVVHGLAEVMKVLAEADAGPMLIAAWLTAKSTDLEGGTAVEHLRRGGEVAPILALALADTARWAS